MTVKTLNLFGFSSFVRRGTFATFPPLFFFLLLHHINTYDLLRFPFLLLPSTGWCQHSDVPFPWREGIFSFQGLKHSRPGSGVRENLSSYWSRLKKPHCGNERSTTNSCSLLRRFANNFTGFHNITVKTQKDGSHLVPQPFSFVLSFFSDTIFFSFFLSCCVWQVSSHKSHQKASANQIKGTAGNRETDVKLTEKISRRKSKVVSRSHQRSIRWDVRANTDLCDTLIATNQLISRGCMVWYMMWVYDGGACLRGVQLYLSWRSSPQSSPAGMTVPRLSLWTFWAQTAGPRQCEDQHQCPVDKRQKHMFLCF